MTAPLTCRWTGDAFAPLGRSKKECDAAMVIGAIYRMAEVQDRSQASHNHEFAWLAEAWRNLPEDLADIYPSPEHLRKRALIEAGFYDETIIDAGSNAGALRVAAEFRKRNDFSLVVVRGPIIVIRDAKSQSRRAMGAKMFNESKAAIMAVVSEMIGVGADDLQRNAGRAA